jgi:methionyl-tRNA synthetase
MSIEDKKNFYITTTLPYVNAEPHIGFAAEIVRADVIARYQRNLGKTVFFNTGTDEHGLKIYNKAQENNLEPQKYCDEYAAKFDNLKQALNLSYNSFIRTTDEHHLKAAQEFWRLCEQNGDIYKKTYSAKYCVGCELEKTDSELDHGRCPLHPDKDLEVIEEENYFFRFSKYQEKLLELYQNNASFVLPDFRLKEIKNFVEAGLNDFSISRLKSKMPWGVPVPGDENQVMYVWFDALVNYISCLGWPDNKNQFNEYWPVIQVAGKDNLRQQSAIWQAMLLSAGLKPSQQILIFGFITANGQKMSKSLGNTIDPYEVVTKYGTDPLRYYLLSEIKVFYDSDFSYEKFDKLYNADLANGLGNLVARVSNLLEKNEIKLNLIPNSDPNLIEDFTNKMNTYAFDEVLKVLWQKIKESDEFITLKKPWQLNDKEEIKKVLEPLAQNILNIATLLEPFLPETAQKIQAQFKSEQIKKGESLFPRITS